MDGSGSAYVTGFTVSVNFPYTVGAYDISLNGLSDAFVTKLDPTGSALVYSTYLGGSYEDQGNGITVDGAGNAYITGQTRSPDFPTGGSANYNAGLDVFVAKIDPSGSTLSFSACLGGSNDDIGNDIALDNSGYVYVVGNTDSTDFPTSAGAYDESYNESYSGPGHGDTFMAVLDLYCGVLCAPSSFLHYSTYLGGSSLDYGNGIALDSSGNIYLTGATGSMDFPATAGAYDTSKSGYRDVFAAKFAPCPGPLCSSGFSLSYSTFIGGALGDDGYGIAVDGFGNAYVTGYTQSGDFPFTAGAYDTSFNGGNDSFVAKLDPSGSALVYSTFLGGTNSDSGYDIAVDSSGNAYVTGSTWSTNFPTTPDAYDTSYNLWEDAFVSKLDTSGSALVYSTYLGGFDEDDVGHGIVVDALGNPYVTGYTSSPDFPTTPVAYDTIYDPQAGFADQFVAKFNLLYFEETDPAITYTGTWTPYACAPCSGGGLKYSRQTGARADFSFTGTGIKWTVAKGPLMGKARVYLDGVNMGLVDLYNPTNRPMVVLQKTGLTAGAHTAAIVVSGLKNPGATGLNITLDAFEVVP